MRKIICEYRREQGTKNTITVTEEMTLYEMFGRFMLFKKTEGLASSTINDYYSNFAYFKEFIGEDLSPEEITKDVFRHFFGYMLHEKELSPVKANVGIRTLRTFIRFCVSEGYNDVLIHENIKTIKTREDTLQSFNPAEIKLLLNANDDELYTGFRDKVTIFVLLDTH